MLVFNKVQMINKNLVNYIYYFLIINQNILSIRINFFNCKKFDDHTISSIFYYV